MSRGRRQEGAHRSRRSPGDPGVIAVPGTPRMIAAGRRRRSPRTVFGNTLEVTELGYRFEHCGERVDVVGTDDGFVATIDGKRVAEGRRLYDVLDAILGRPEPADAD